MKKYKICPLCKIKFVIKHGGQKFCSNKHMVKYNRAIYCKNNRERMKKFAREWARENSKKNRDKINKYQQEWRRKNKEKCREWRRKNRQTEKFKSARNKWQRKRYAENPIIRLSMTISRGIRLALNGKKHGKKWQKITGYNLIVFKSWYFLYLW